MPIIVLSASRRGDAPPGADAHLRLVRDAQSLAPPALAGRRRRPAAIHAANDQYYFQVLRYIERNALRAGLAARAEHWKWCSLSTWKSPEPDETWPLAPPHPCGEGWVEHVNQPQTEAEVEAIRLCTRRGRPLGSQPWVERTAHRLGLASTLRDRGRPKAESSPENAT